MNKQCINLELPQHLMALVSNAIGLVRRYGVSSRVRENAELFVKIHIVPMNEMVRLNGKSINLLINALRTYAIGLDDATLNVIVGQGVYCSRRRGANAHAHYRDYVNSVIALLSMFAGYFIMGDVLNYLILSYEQLSNKPLISRSCRGNGCIGLLNQLLNTMLCSIMKVGRDVRGTLNVESGKMLMAIMTSEDCTYLGIVGN